MKAIIVFIDGTICDRTAQLDLFGNEAFYTREAIMQAKAVPGSAQCIMELSKYYTIIYIGARPIYTEAATKEWLFENGFPAGNVCLANTQAERMQLVKNIPNKKDIFAGIGDRWDDNELHLALGCMSIILKENDGNWDTVRKYLLNKKPNTY
jgi:uncharacterized HAD superfamily protein